MKRREVKSRWKQTEILVIDEISMLSAEMFDILSFVGMFFAVHLQSAVCACVCLCACVCVESAVCVKSAVSSFDFVHQLVNSTSLIRASSCRVINYLHYLPPVSYLSPHAVLSHSILYCTVLCTVQ